MPIARLRTILLEGKKRLGSHVVSFIRERSDVLSRKRRTSDLAFFKPFSPSILVLLIIPVILLGLWQVPQWLLSSKKISTPDKQAELENAYRATLVQTLGGVFFFVTALLSWRNVEVAEEKQVTERFSKAIELFGSDKLEVRLGGIYALERIAKDSPKDHWTIMEVLTSFVRQKTMHQIGKITLDIQAALTVIGRRDSSADPKNRKLDLSDTKLIEAQLFGANLSRANLYKCRLMKVDLSNALLMETHFGGSTLFEPIFTGAIFSETNFSGVKGLTPNKVKSAQGWEQAIYDEDFRKELGLLTESENDK